jgi:hypothetical protein
MAHRTGSLFTLLAAATLVVATGCSDVGSVGDGTPPDDDDVGFNCQAELAITGAFTPDGAGVDAEGSCVPTGTWTLEVTVSDQGDCTEVPATGTYVYTVIEDELGYDVVYTDDPNSDYTFAKVTVEGPCQGSFEHYSADGTQLTLLKPYTETDNVTLAGSGVYEVYPDDQLGED